MDRHRLRDGLQRPLHDLRISVTDRCNFRCTYCMPIEKYGLKHSFLPPEQQLSNDELVRLARLFVALGVSKIRLTGGEPLLRGGLPELVADLLSISGVEDMGLTTNGVLLGRLAEPLYDAGLRRADVSLDALDPVLFGRINGRGIEPAVILRNIEIAREIGFDIKVNMVVQKGVNDAQILPMAAYFKALGVPLRLIEFMDVGNDNGWSMDSVVTKQQMLDQLSAVYDLVPVEPAYFGEVANRYRYADGEGEIGFIPSVSASFCSSCTRARLSSDGQLYTCLFASAGFDVKTMLRNGSTDEQLSDTIAAVWQQRTDRYSDLRSEITSARSKIGMSYIGG